MIGSARVAVVGGEDVLAGVIALGLEPVTEGPQVAVIDVRRRERFDSRAVAADVPRVFIAGESERGFLAVLGIEPSRIAATAEAAVLGPVLMRVIPTRSRSATRAVVVSGVRGGVGRTLLATNIARRLASKMRVCVIDATGTGAAGWWLRTTPRSWSTLEGLVDEMSSDHLSVAAEDTGAGLRLVGGPPVMPSAALLAATTRAAVALDDLVVIDAPLAVDPIGLAAIAQADRCLVLSYEDPWSRVTLDGVSLPEDVWLIASQARVAKIGDHEVFRSLPRDEPSVASAVATYGVVKGGLGRAYDDLAELLLIDAT
jgi:hypothetical protein